MNGFPKVLAMLFLISGVGGIGSHANAQAVRSFVSVNGSDNNPCSTSAPCRTIGAALAVTASAGEIFCLTSGGYGSVTITKSIAIVCDRVDAALTGINGGAAVTIAAGANDGVTLQGLHISGAGTGAVGVNVTSVGAVLINQCVLSGFLSGAGTAINVQPTSGTAKVTVKDSSIVGNLTGINENAASASSGVGISVTGTLLGANLTTAIAMNGGSVGAALAADKSQITGNAAAITASGLAAVAFSGSLVSGNTAFFTLSNGAGVYSYGNNQFSNNGGVTGPNTSGYSYIGPQ